MGNNCSCLHNKEENSRISEKEPNGLLQQETNAHCNNDNMNVGLKQSEPGNEDNIISPLMINKIGVDYTNNVTNTNSSSNSIVPVNEKHELSSSSSLNIVIPAIKRKPSQKKGINSEVRKSPLEVINELNGEISKGSCEHKDSFSNHQKQIISKEGSNKAIDINTHIINYNYNHIPITKNEDNNINSNISIEEKKVKSKAITRSGQKKTWKEMQINTIIPISKLKYINENDLLIQGEFYKSTKDKETKRFILTSNFLYLTKAELR